MPSPTQPKRKDRTPKSAGPFLLGKGHSEEEENIQRQQQRTLTTAERPKQRGLGHPRPELPALFMQALRANRSID
jgi:hypothetical protein